MKKTLHARTRIHYRNVPDAVVDLLFDHGAPLPQNPDRLLLTREHVRELRAAGQIRCRMFHLAEKAAPLVAVMKNGLLVTVFRPNRSVNRATRRRPRHCGRVRGDQ